MAFNLSKSFHYLQGMNETFDGCLRNIKVDSKDLGNADRIVGVSKCSNNTEDGAFFHGSGGYVKLCK